MQIRFVRSGGFSGAATNVSGTVEITPEGGSVRGEGAPYQREVPPQEAEQLRAGADPKVLERAKAALSKPSPVRDGYQYDVTVTGDDGSTSAVSFTGDGTSDELRQIAPGAASLGSWVRDEAQKIWKSKINARQ